MKFLIFLFAIFSLSTAQSISCIYQDHVTFGYSCYITLFNRGGLNNFTEISGVHLEGRSNADVNSVIAYDGDTPIIPNILCSQFVNLIRLDLSLMFINTLSEDTFTGCPNLMFLNLWDNYIREVPENAFANNPRLIYVDFDMNRLTNIGENTFTHLVDLEILVLRNNPFQDIPAGTFSTLRNLTNLYLDNCRITELKPEWFVNLVSLRYLELFYNEIRVIPQGIFLNNANVRTLDIAMNPFEYLSFDTFHAFTQLQNLYMDNCFLTDFHPEWFDQLVSLEVLILYNNRFSNLPANAFTNLVNLRYLRLDNNPLGVISPGLFQSLGNLQTISLSNVGITELRREMLENSPNLVEIYLGYNRIEELPVGVFSHMHNLTNFGINDNRLKVLRRNAFGSLTNLSYLNLNENVINGLDMEFFDAAEKLNRFLFTNNICASGQFPFFQQQRDRILPYLERCFRNIRYIIDTITEPTDDYQIFQGLNPGIAIRINTPNEAHIALMAVPFVSIPRIEIFIGIANNTRSAIRRNGASTDVVNISTPNILESGRWSDFRVIWANFMISVFRGNEEFPFMVWNMDEIWPVDHYALKSPGNRGAWSVQPIGL